MPVVFWRCAEIVSRHVRVVLNGTIAVGLKWSNLDVVVWTGVAPNDAVSNVGLAVGIDASIAPRSFVLYYGAVVKICFLGKIATASNFSCIVVDKATPECRPLFVGYRDAASLLSRVVSKSAVDKLTGGALADATDPTSATQGMVVVENTAEKCCVSIVSDGSTKICLIVKELTVFDKDIS